MGPAGDAAAAGNTGAGKEPAPASDARPESVAERDDRNLAELIQELRVVSLGVQVLFGFLLSLPFTVRFGPRLRPGPGRKRSAGSRSPTRSCRPGS